MLELFRKDMQIYVKVLMNLRIPIKYQNKVFGKGEKNELLFQSYRFKNYRYAFCRY